MTARIDIVNSARSFIGTPHHHGARVSGVGIDCIGLPICVMRNLGLVPPDYDVPPYTRHPDGVSLVAWCRNHLVPVPQVDTRVGDMIVVAIDRYAQHVGIIGDYQHGGFSIIHAAAMSVSPRVIETRLMFSPKMRFVACFSLVDGVR